MKSIKYFFCALLYFCMCAFSCLNCPGYDNPSTDATKRPRITVYIHGTRLTPDLLSRKYLFRILGMHKITEYDRYYNCRTIAEMLQKIDPEQYNIDHYYYFGWSGKLCFTERKAAAKEFYKALEKLYQEYKNLLGEGPIFRIITHSHGGNVLLNLAKIIPKNSPLVIEQAILLACPVQERTKHFLASPRFKKVYAFYSGGDLIQVLDPQGWYKKGKTKKRFSGRTFPASDNLKQACIKINGRHPMHLDFFLPKFMAHLPNLCKTLDEWYETTPTSEADRIKQLTIRNKKHPAMIEKTIL